MQFTFAIHIFTLSQTACSAIYLLSETWYEVKTCQLGVFKFSSAGGETLQLNAISGSIQISLSSSISVKCTYCSALKRCRGKRKSQRQQKHIPKSWWI